MITYLEFFPLRITVLLPALGPEEYGGDTQHGDNYQYIQRTSHFLTNNQALYKDRKDAHI